ncbi:MAG: DUF4058 family protein [Cyanobacteria bacterium P01_D01_bin.156]
MPSPLPGMNPFIEQPELWPEFHSRMIVAIADSLDELLSRNYRVAVEKRVYLSQNDEQILVGIPDVAVTSPKKTPDSLRGGNIAFAEPQIVEIPQLEEVQERYLEIREGGKGTVITTIELLSPKNKRSGERRDAYLSKRQQVLSSRTNLVEIDLLRGGRPLPIKGNVSSDYRVLISRSHERPQAQLYGFNLDQTIPAFEVPLQRNDASPTLALQPLLHRIYDRARFELAIDYNHTLSPQLRPVEQQWILDFIG